jgi:hypothetical protein
MQGELLGLAPAFPVVPISAVFVAAGAAKLRGARTLRFRLIEWGMGWLASPSKIRLLGALELTAGSMALASAFAGWALALPAIGMALSFTLFLVTKRPESCGCGVWEMGWRVAALRNLTLITMSSVYVL